MNRREFVPYLTRIGRQCENDLEQIDIHCGDVIEYRVPDHISEWGLCTKSGDGRFYIDVSYTVIAGGSLRGIKTIVYHELLHTIPGCYRHAAKWKNNAKLIKQRIGYDINITIDFHELGIDFIRSRNLLKYKYALVCQKCGQVLTYKRKCKVVEYPIFYKCGNCGGKFKLITNVGN